MPLPLKEGELRLNDHAKMCRTVLYGAAVADKTVALSMRVTPQFKRLLELAATAEQRSQTNLLEKLLMDHCRAKGLMPKDKQTH